MKEFIEKLASYRSVKAVFNPWSDYSEQLDIGPDAPLFRKEHLRRYLEQRIGMARYIFVAEALGFKGGRFSGIPMTSERILTGKYADIDYRHIFPGEPGRRTSNPRSQYPGFKKAWKKEGLSEQTATIVWKTILENDVNPYEIILWNIFPFHPYHKEKGLLSNRTPVKKELKFGVYYLKRLLDLCREDIQVISVGTKSKETLDAENIENIPIAHPANGGAPKFKEGCRMIFLNNKFLSYT